MDLGAWPGGWLQVAAEAAGPRGRVIAADLVPLDPWPPAWGGVLCGGRGADAVRARRGAAVGGVPRRILRDRRAAGPATTGSCMAPVRGSPGSLGATEGMPTELTAPSVLVGEVELVAVAGDPMAVPVLPPR